MSSFEALSGIDGADLRVVAQLESLDYDVQYLRDDLTETYVQPDFDQAYQAMMANQVSVDDFADVGTFGDLDCQVLLFDDVIVFLFPSSRYDGVFASFDRAHPFPLLEVVDQFDTIAPQPTATEEE